MVDPQIKPKNALQWDAQVEAIQILFLPYAYPFQ